MSSGSELLSAKQRTEQMDMELKRVSDDKRRLEEDLSSQKQRLEADANQRLDEKDREVAMMRRQIVEYENGANRLEL